MQAFMDITRALGDEARVRALSSLSDGELCVCQIIDLLGLSPSTVSRHMSILQQAGLVKRRKDGRWHYYQLAGREASPMVRQTLRWVQKSLENQPTITADAKTLCCIKTKKREELTACYSGN